jgi:hypothetical protein
MIGIHRMAKPETVGKKGGAQQNRKMTEGHDRPQPSRSIEYNQDAVDPQHLTAGVPGCIVEEGP